MHYRRGKRSDDGTLTREVGTEHMCCTQREVSSKCPLLCIEGHLGDLQYLASNNSNQGFEV